LKKISIGVFLVILYCFPFVYFSMKQDFANRSMIGYLIMIVSTSLLAFIAKYFCSSIPFIIGNILSLVISFYFNGKMSETHMWNGGYFKPFYTSQLIVVISLLNLIPQYIAIVLANKVHNMIKIKFNRKLN
jgi:hypothetical protein